MSRPDHILIVDDDAELRRLLSGFLERYGYRTTAVADGDGLRERLRTRQIDLIVLDLMLPGDDGIALTREVRRDPRMAHCPIVMLTARGEPVDRVIGLEVGADDYLPKPFDPRELLARIRSVLRRARMPEHGTDSEVRELRFAGWILDLGAHTLKAESGRTTVTMLTDAEFSLLRLLAENPRRVLTRDDITEATIGRQALPQERRIDVQVCRLRNLLDDGRHTRLIRTVRNRGYEFCVDVERR